MFENIIGHEVLINQLRTEINTSNLPYSLLFFGEPYNGKLTAALEAARVLSCKKTGNWGCTCTSCKKHRLLESSNTLLLGSRSFMEEISVCAETLKRTLSQAAQFMFIRAVRKLIRRFDDVLWRNQDQKLKKIIPDLEKLNENLELVLPGRRLPETEILLKVLSNIKTSAGKIESSIKNEGIPIQQVRNINYWVHTTNNDAAKIIILDGADKLGEGSRNALLKILEEPPESVYFILISKRKEGIIPTILSRVRPYYFAPRDTDLEKQVIERIFRDTGDFSGSLRDYFLLKNDIDQSLLKAYALKMLKDIVDKQEIDAVLFDTITEYVCEEKNFIPFLEELTALYRKILRRETDSFENITVQTLYAWYNALNEVLKNRELYNQNTSLLISSLIYSMREHRI